MRLLDNILALMPCGKPQATFLAHLLALLQWLPGGLNFTGLEAHGGWSARTHARWFGRPFPFARLAVGTLAAVHPRVAKGLGELLVVDTSFVAKSGRKTWGVGWFWSGMARAVRQGLEVSLLAAVDVEEGGAYPLCARQSPAPGRARGKKPDGETAVAVGLALLREALAAGAGELLGTRWVGRGRGLQQPALRRGGAGAGPAHGGPVAPRRRPAPSLHRPPSLPAGPPPPVRRSLRPRRPDAPDAHHPGRGKG